MTQIEQKFEQSIGRALNKAVSENHEVLETIERLKTLLLIKGKEYRRNNDPYHNFNEGAKLMGVRPMTVLNFFSFTEYLNAKLKFLKKINERE